MNKIQRREMIQTMGTICAAGGMLQMTGSTALGAQAQKTTMPSFLKGYEELYKTDPRKASIEWFRNAKFGLFMHYGLYSLLGRHEWVQLREKIPVAEYAKLKDKFTAEKFDADFITDLALEANMKYINITTRHHDSFCLFDSKYTDFKSTNSPAKRDLVGELTEQCAKKKVWACAIIIPTVATGAIPTHPTTETGAAAPAQNIKLRIHTTKQAMSMTCRFMWSS